MVVVDVDVVDVVDVVVVGSVPNLMTLILLSVVIDVADSGPKTVMFSTLQPPLIVSNLQDGVLLVLFLKVK